MDRDVQLRFPHPGPRAGDLLMIHFKGNQWVIPNLQHFVFILRKLFDGIAWCICQLRKKLPEDQVDNERDPFHQPPTCPQEFLPWPPWDARHLGESTVTRQGLYLRQRKGQNSVILGCKRISCGLCVLGGKVWDMVTWSLSQGWVPALSRSSKAAL